MQHLHHKIEKGVKAAENGPVVCKATFKKNDELFTKSKTNIDRTLFPCVETTNMLDEMKEQIRTGE